MQIRLTSLSHKIIIRVKAHSSLHVTCRQRCKGCYALKSLRVKEHAAHKQDRLPGSAFILNIQQAWCNENVCSFTSIVYSCKRASLTNIQGGIKTTWGGKKRKRNIVQFLDIQGLICVINIVSNFMNKFILIKAINIIAKQPQPQPHKQ